MKKVYTKTGKLSYIEYTDKEIQDIRATIAKVEDKKIRLSLTKKFKLC